jgi:hypothetical protein
VVFPPPPPSPTPSRVDDVARVAKFLKWQAFATLAWAAFCTTAAGFIAYVMVLGRGGSDEPAVLVLYTVLGLVSWTAGILQVTASGRMRAFQSRGMCFVALWSNVASFFCGGAICCLPTGIALVVYGMTVLMDPSVVEAFERAKNTPPG